MKKVLSIILAIVMLLSIYPISVSADESSDSYETSLEISTELSSYTWGDTISFDIVIANTGDSVIDYATVSATPQFSKYFSGLKTSATVSGIASDASKTVKLSFKSGCGFIEKIFMPFIVFFGIGKTPEYDFLEIAKEESVKIGFCGFDFGFVVEYGYENTATGKEISKIEELNGKIPDIYMDVEDSVPSFIDGTFSNDTIRNENDALESLNDIKNLMGFENVDKELDFYQKDTYGDNTFYRFRQYYDGIEVYPKNVIVVTDKNNKTSALSNDYEPGISINTNPTITEENAIDIAKMAVGSTDEAVSEGLKIYAKGTDPTLTYMILCSGIDNGSSFNGYVFVDAHLGYAVAKENLIVNETVSATTDGITFNVWRNNDSSYELRDATRNIEVFDAQQTEIQVFGSGIGDMRIVPSNSVTSSSQNTWDNEAATMMFNLSKIYDYYKVNYDRDSFNGNGGRIVAVVNEGMPGGGIPGNNGFSVSDINFTTTVIAMGYVTGSDRLDVLAHEFLHSTERYIANMTGGNNETGGLKEAYADILGEVVAGDTDWLHGTSRNIADPSQTGNPEKKGLLFGSNMECHYISTIVSHAAYLMYQDEISNMDRLGELWYRSMYYLDENSTFEDCRAAVIAAARDMGMSNDEIVCICDAFDEVGIEGTYLSHFGFSTVSGRVLDASNMQPIAGAQVIALKTAPNEWGAGIVETDTNGCFEITGLSSGTYEISVDAHGYIPEFRYNVTVGSFTNVTLPSSILLDKSVMTDGAVGGRITNATTGNAVDGATIKFRKDHGVTEGSYVTGWDGSVISTETDSNGKYSCDGLRSGYYTMEVSKDGFITSYYDVIAAPSNNICMNQNFTISPELPEGQYRIVLSWGENPRDLDSHITGMRTDGSKFHVYYSDKNAYDGEVHVANLDVDDTSGFGPETITLIPTTAETYTYYIHRFAGSGTIATSNAKVEVYKGNALIAVYAAPRNHQGDIWTVFEITNGTSKRTLAAQRTVCKKCGKTAWNNTQHIPAMGK